MNTAAQIKQFRPNPLLCLVNKAFVQICLQPPPKNQLHIIVMHTFYRQLVKYLTIEDV